MPIYFLLSIEVARVKHLRDAVSHSQLRGQLWIANTYWTESVMRSLHNWSSQVHLEQICDGLS
jgi:hypothetical protein